MYCTDYEDHVQTIILVLYRLWRSCTHNNPCTVQIMKIVYNKPCLESKGWSCTDHVSLLHIKTISSHLFPRQLYNLKGTVRVISWYFIIFFICHDLTVNFKNIYSCFEDFWSWRRHFHIFQECSRIQRQRNIIFKKTKQKYYEI